MCFGIASFTHRYYHAARGETGAPLADEELVRRRTVSLAFVRDNPTCAVLAARKHQGQNAMAKGQEKKATSNKPKLTVKEKKAKKKEAAKK